MTRITRCEGLDESTARLVVAQEEAHGRYVKTCERDGRWTVTVYLPGLELTPAAPDWLRQVWRKEKEDE